MHEGIGKTEMQRIPQFVVGGMCGGAAYLYFVDNLHDKWHPITREIWNIQIPPKQNVSINYQGYVLFFWGAYFACNM